MKEIEREREREREREPEGKTLERDKSAGKVKKQHLREGLL